MVLSHMVGRIKVFNFDRLPNNAALGCGWLECDGLNLRQEETDFKQRQISSGYVIYAKGRNIDPKSRSSPTV